MLCIQDLLFCVTFILFYQHQQSNLIRRTIKNILGFPFLKQFDLQLIIINSKTMCQVLKEKSNFYTMSQNKNQKFSKQLYQIVLQKINEAGLYVKNNSQSSIEQFSVSSISKVDLLPQYQIYLQTKIKDLSQFITRAQIYKNGQKFSVRNKWRIGYIMEYANTLGSLLKYGTCSIDPISNIIQFSISKSTTSRRSCYNKLVKTVKLDMQKLLEYVMFNIYYILFLASEVDQTQFEILIQKGERSRRFPQELDNKLDEAIANLIKNKRNQTLLLQTDSIKQFLAEQLLPKNTIINSQLNKSTKINQIHQDNDSSWLQVYKALIKQFPYPNSQFEDPNNYSPIIFQKTQEGIDSIKWDLFIKTQNVQIYKGKGKFYVLNICSSNKNNQKQETSPKPKYIQKFLIKKVLKDKKKARHQKQILANFKTVSAVSIGKYYQVVDSRQYQNSIVMDLYSQSSANIFLKQNHKVLSMRTKMLLFPMIIQGVRCLRDLNISHCDLKFENILIGRGLIARLSDFGESKKVGQKNQNIGYTLPFTSPQFFSNSKISSKMDVYSLGIMIDLLYTNSFLVPSKKSYSHNLVKCLREKEYLKLISFCPQKYFEVFLLKKISQIVFSTALKCIDYRDNKRPNLDILCILHKIVQRITDGIIMI